MSIKKLKRIPLATEVVAESYFADMAKDGLLLESVTPFYYEFREDMPKEMDYCVVPLALYQDAEQTRVNCEEKGWHYIGKEGNFYVFGAEKEANVESEAKKRERYEAWAEKHRKKLLQNSIAVVVSTILGFRQLADLVSTEQSVSGFGLYSISAILIFFGIAFHQFWELKCNRSVLGEIDEGRAFEEGIDWQAGWSVSWWMQWIVIIFASLSLMISTVYLNWKIIGRMG